MGGIPGGHHTHYPLDIVGGVTECLHFFTFM